VIGQQLIAYYVGREGGDGGERQCRCVRRGIVGAFCDWVPDLSNDQSTLILGEAGGRLWHHARRPEYELDELCPDTIQIHCLIVRFNKNLGLRTRECFPILSVL
jgi:hypothetical protein